jgi:hypothetical protein
VVGARQARARKKGYGWRRDGSESLPLADEAAWRRCWKRKKGGGLMSGFERKKGGSIGEVEKEAGESGLGRLERGQPPPGPDGISESG